MSSQSADSAKLPFREMLEKAFAAGFQECMGEYEIDSGVYTANGEAWNANVPGYAKRYAEAALENAEQPEDTPTDVRAIVERLGFDPTNHHNAAKCPYCCLSKNTTEQSDGRVHMYCSAAIVGSTLESLEHRFTVRHDGPCDERCAALDRLTKIEQALRAPSITASDVETWRKNTMRPDEVLGFAGEIPITGRFLLNALAELTDNA